MLQERQFLGCKCFEVSTKALGSQCKLEHRCSETVNSDSILFPQISWNVERSINVCHSHTGVSRWSHIRIVSDWNAALLHIYQAKAGLAQVASQKALIAISFQLLWIPLSIWTRTLPEPSVCLNTPEPNAKNAVWLSSASPGHLTPSHQANDRSLPFLCFEDSQLDHWPEFHGTFQPKPWSWWPKATAAAS